jgi:Leucine-rich repeat (LRR) protein
VICLSENEIEEILHPIFAKNKKLEFADLSCNKIRTLHPNLFEDLPRLVEVNFDDNPTVDKKFDQSNMKMMNVELKPAFDNYYALVEGYSMRIKQLELVSWFFVKSPGP